KPSQLKGVAGKAQINVTATLYWSECVDGAWQPPHTSDVNKPLTVGTFDQSGDGAFDRSALTMRSSVGANDELYVYVGYPAKSESWFKLYNTHSLPVRAGDESDSPFAGGLILNFGLSRFFSATNPPFTATYWSGWLGDEPDQRTVLAHGSLYNAVQPRHELTDPFTAPFFFQDRRYVFYVTSTAQQITVPYHTGFGVVTAPPKVAFDVPILVQPEWQRPPGTPVYTPGTAVMGSTDPAPLREYMQQNGNITQVIGVNKTVRFGDQEIGPGGSIKIAGATLKGGF
ncbi:MAG TPA: hypothetical protein VFK80_03865, partial [Limnochordia bacterium]|nr:hypothetical protein [Limnochordia bacterium]